MALRGGWGGICCCRLDRRSRSTTLLAWLDKSEGRLAASLDLEDVVAGEEVTGTHRQFVTCIQVLPNQIKLSEEESEVTSMVPIVVSLESQMRQSTMVNGCRPYNQRLSVVEAVVVVLLVHVKFNIFWKFF
ncbi:hypothetical protein COLO4_33101 [Corchorus olitorius]|uniref:Uncharacterized protein n=1 Tax=Corchorus olitorius TaxID=93759 RepID=A0A1R3GWI6_9ROSI|nr:hypothetical protein COLO4_33101 [Corchorus olitorius]